MRVVIATLLLSLSATNAFAPAASCFSRPALTLSMAADQAEIDAKVAEVASTAERWRSVKSMDLEQVEKECSEEELGAYKGFYASVKEELEGMEAVATIFAKQYDVKITTAKSKNQRKRDAYVRKMARQGIKVEPRGFVAQE
jgi:hypothetical protein